MWESAGEEEDGRWRGGEVEGAKGRRGGGGWGEGGNFGLAVVLHVLWAL